jgi:hypothetical protein
MVEQDGWYRVVTEGSHRQYKHATKRGRVTINGHPGDDMPKGTGVDQRQAAGTREEIEATVSGADRQGRGKDWGLFPTFRVV